MLQAERRTRKTGQVLSKKAIPLFDQGMNEMDIPKNASLHWWNAILPIVIVILVTTFGLWYNGRAALISQSQVNPSLRMIIGAANPFSSLLWSSFAGCLCAGVLALSQRILNLRQTLDAWMTGVKSMVLAMIVIVLAWSIGSICEDLKTAEYTIKLTQNFLSPHFLPVLTFLVAAFISFSTGTSWGTMAILIPIVIPIAWTYSSQSTISSEPSSFILTSTIASVLSGAIFGDHCSPISDTTIMSSMASGADHIDHVRTQLPYAILVALVAIVTGYLPVGFGVSPFISIPSGILILIVIIIIVGKKSTVQMKIDP